MDYELELTKLEHNKKVMFDSACLFFCLFLVTSAWTIYRLIIGKYSDTLMIGFVFVLTITLSILFTAKLYEDTLSVFKAHKKH